MMLLAKFMYDIRFALYGLMLGILFLGASLSTLLILSLALFPVIYYLDKKFIRIK